MADKAVFGGWTLVTHWAPEHTELLLEDAHGVVRAILHPLQLDNKASITTDGWYLADLDPELQTVRADGHLIYDGGVISYSLSITFPNDPEAEPLKLDWLVNFGDDPDDGYIIHRVTIPGAQANDALDAPDAGVHYSTDAGTWLYFAAENPPALVSQFHVNPANDSAEMTLRYPKREGTALARNDTATNGARLKKRLYLWYRPPTAGYSYGDIAPYVAT